MIKFIIRIGKKYFGNALDLRVRLFNILAVGGTIVSLVMAVFGLINAAGVLNVMTNLLVAALSFTLFTVSRRTGRYQICYMTTVIGIFMCFFPVLFFSSGGYHSGMPAFFVFAVAFTIFMLEGKKAIILSASELLLYITICIFAYLHPEAVHFFETEQDLLTDIIVAFTIVSIVLGICMFLHFRLYNEQHRKLDDQNILLARASLAKTEFLSNVSHEMRTPLTVISVNVQTALDILKDNAVQDPEAAELLCGAQNEIMRLSRMVGGMLTLASISENTERQTVNFTALLNSSAETMRLSLTKRGNALTVNIEEDLRVFGSADLLVQVLSNLLTNAGAHTEKGSITLEANRNGGEITATVRDTGTGISPDLLPHVFERGVSDGGTGFGLYLCKTVVESHGGRIWIESKQGAGTNVFFTLPVYEGQFGGDAI